MNWCIEVLWNDHLNIEKTTNAYNFKPEQKSAKGTILCDFFWLLVSGSLMSQWALMELKEGDDDDGGGGGDETGPT